ncbi:hypothetical protein GOV04_02415 [Candidatus Woesearchaeota archaeon]|nr:hypothetical protein [Candidatus Woesearchaeota archaeon]
MNNQPEKKFRIGSISATIWKNSALNKQGEETSFNTISIERGYKDKNDEWQSTNSLRVGDLPKAELVLKKAYEHIMLDNSADQESAQA